MWRLGLLLLLPYAAFLLARAFRLTLMPMLGSDSVRRTRRMAPAEMVRDPVCGVWIDSRLALDGWLGAERVRVCSEQCRGRLKTLA